MVSESLSIEDSKNELTDMIVQLNKNVGVLGKRNSAKSAAEKYTNRLINKFNYVKILGMTKPVKLKNIYVRINILEQISSDRRETLELIEEQLMKGFGVVQSTRPGIQVVNEFDNIILLGKPGAGKTTFLKYLVLASLENQLKATRIPIFISLKELADSNVDLIEYIEKEFSICNFTKPNETVTGILNSGHCLLLFDGIDEVEISKLQKIVNMVTDFVLKFVHNKYIISCRIAAYNYWFPNFRAVEIADFEETEIRNFIKNWFFDSKEAQEKCLSKFEESPRVKQIATIPLLLTLLCLAFEQTNDFPPNKAELYKEAIDALLKKWDASRWIHRTQIYRQLSLKMKEVMLSEIAYRSFTKTEYVFKQEVLEKYIKDFVFNLPGFSNRSLTIDSEAILKSIESHHGIFVEKAKYIYSFSHLTFQEYFTSRYISANASQRMIEKLINNYFEDVQLEGSNFID